MDAVQLKFADGKGTGLWYCGKCRDIKRSLCGQGKRVSPDHRAEAEKCCTGATDWIPNKWKLGGKCTGCKRYPKQCVCGRASQHCCVACGRKLFQKEGRKVRWGAEIREICYQCSNNPALATKLMDARK